MPQRKKTKITAISFTIVTIIATLVSLSTPSLLQKQNRIPENYVSIIKRLTLHVEETNQNYTYPDQHVIILANVGNPPMVYVGYEDLNNETSKWQWNDCNLWIEKGLDGKWWIEGRFTGAYHKSLWFRMENNTNYLVAEYFNEVWFTLSYDPMIETIKKGEYW